MELFFTAVTIALVGAAYCLLQHVRSPSALCRKPMSAWLARYQAATPVEQHEMAEMLLRQSARLASRMGVEVHIDRLLPDDGDPITLLQAWQAQLSIAIPAQALPNTPARTVGALLLIRDVQPESFRQLLGQAIAS
ncbi:hypothetical protein F7R01_02300 [Pseudomonas argentinensis]|uniref:Uncharacterized protein n=1 Tax=Phytopseudomonas argentinensis TaxID=289370 RepID=A0A1I3NB06_9GAMM|nr:hypothetical protein [Pseudomonas argentinensis]KAB0550067.1 hypothetical protein F7R01_02300 [Pseudomonas argentinensis]SFJ06402.1 hypothetical protein SAMN05216602_3713 [Pseudomonas argentinensis]